MVKCKYEGTGIWDGRCTGTKEVDPCPGYDKCKQYKPNYTTNADRIRTMSDEELVEYLAKPCECSVDPTTDGYRECGNDLCKKHLLEWLKQPAEGE